VSVDEEGNCAGGVQPFRDDDRMAWHTNNSHMLQAARPQVARQPRRAALHILSMPGLRAYARKADELGECAKGRGRTCDASVAAAVVS
jgi:hypothetical protein